MLAPIAAEGCDAICVIGDVVGSGTYPTEYLNRVLHTADRSGVRDNRDSWFAFGQPDPLPQRMGSGEPVHNRRERGGAGSVRATVGGHGLVEDRPD